MITTISKQLSSFTVMVMKIVSHGSASFSGFSFKKKLACCLALISGLALLISPFAINSTAKSNQQISDASASDPISQVSDSLNTADKLSTEGQISSPDISINQKSEGQSSTTSVTSSVSFKSSISSGNTNSPVETHVTDESSNGQQTKTITQSSADGQSKATFKINAGDNADMTVKERNGRIRINIEQNKEIN